MAILLLPWPYAPDVFLVAFKELASAIQVWCERDPYDPGDIEAVCVFRPRAGLLARLPQLKLVSAMGAGVDALLKQGEIPRHVHLTRVVDPMQGQQMAQYVVAAALNFTRDFDLYRQQQREARWLRHSVRGRQQCRIGILGLGAIGMSVAKVFLALGQPVAAWVRTPRDVDGIDIFSDMASANALAAFMARTDVLICTLPLTEATRGLLNAARLSSLPRGAYLINVGRGDQVVQADLRALLDSGHLAGAALDVFEQEPLDAAHWAWSHPKVFATPHIAGEVSPTAVAAQTLDALFAVRRGELPPNLVDPVLGY